MYPGFDFNVEVKGNVVVPNMVDFGAPLEIIHRGGNRLVVRRRGHTGCAGYGIREYYETKYMLLELCEEHVSAKRSLTGKAFERQFAVVLEEVEPGRKWREAVAKLKVKCKTAWDVIQES